MPKHSFPTAEGFEPGSCSLWFLAVVLEFIQRAVYYAKKNLKLRIKTRAFHGWSRCNGICLAFVYISSYLSGKKTRHKPLHLLQPWQGSVFMPKFRFFLGQCEHHVSQDSKLSEGAVCTVQCAASPWCGNSDYFWDSVSIICHEIFQGGQCALCTVCSIPLMDILKSGIKWLGTKGTPPLRQGGAQMDKGNLRMTRNKVNDAPHLLNKVNNCTISAVVQNILKGFLFCALKASFSKRGF